MVKVEGIYRGIEKVGQELLLDERGFEIILGNGRKDRFFDLIDEDMDLSLFIHHANWAVSRKPNGKYTFINLKPQTLIKHFETIISFLSGKVVVELREDLMSDKELRIIQDLRREVPFLLSIDDFGRGASNLDRVISLQPNFVKVDVSLFNTPLGLMKAVELLNHHTRAVLIAEKVENEKIFRMIRGAGMELWQGWYEKELMKKAGSVEVKEK